MVDGGHDQRAERERERERETGEGENEKDMGEGRAGERDRAAQRSPSRSPSLPLSLSPLTESTSGGDRTSSTARGAARTGVSQRGAELSAHLVGTDFFLAYFFLACWRPGLSFPPSVHPSHVLPHPHGRDRRRARTRCKYAQAEVEGDGWGWVGGVRAEDRGRVGGVVKVRARTTHPPARQADCGAARRT